MPSGCRSADGFGAPRNHLGFSPVWINVHELTRSKRVVKMLSTRVVSKSSRVSRRVTMQQQTKSRLVPSYSKQAEELNAKDAAALAVAKAETERIWAERLATGRYRGHPVLQ